MSPPKSAGIFEPFSRTISTLRLPFNQMKYPASKTTLSRGAETSGWPLSIKSSSFVKRKIPALQREAASSI